jgi:hypothetical protein
VNIRRFKKSAAALAIAILCLLAGFALTLAHEQGPGRSIAAAASSHDGGWIAQSYFQSVCFEFAAGDLPSGPQKSVLARVSHLLPPARETLPVHQRPFARKIARHMLDSILLI